VAISTSEGTNANRCPNQAVELTADAGSNFTN